MGLTRRGFLGAAVLAPAAAEAAWYDDLNRQAQAYLFRADHGLNPYLGADRALGQTGLLPAADPVVHLLNRTSFGIRQEDMERAHVMGINPFIDTYLEQQLNPEGIADADTDQRIAQMFPAAQLPRNLLLLHYGGSSPLSPSSGSGVAERDSRAITVFRQLYSRRQLYEVMVDFWSNHFNIYSSENGAVRLHKLLDDRDVIRPNAMGTFRNLLLASAKSTAMLYYLDNWLNTAKGPNENYARELMELHTLGVDGGYEQADVVDVARCFTGWTVDFTVNDLRDGRKKWMGSGEFIFNHNWHDTGAKRVLGHDIPAGGGIDDGLKVIDILLEHPATARFIATKLVRRFVADNPAPYSSLIARVAAAFRGHGGPVVGDIRAMLRVILTSEEFRQSHDEKIKRPLEFFVSALRSTAANVDVYVNASRMPEYYGYKLLGQLDLLGQLPFNWPTPDGYPDDKMHWINSNGLLQRWLVARDLGSGGKHPTAVDIPALYGNASTGAQLVENLRQRILFRSLLPEDRARFENYATDGAPANVPLPPAVIAAKARGLVGLMLSSPYFNLR